MQNNMMAMPDYPLDGYPNGNPENGQGSMMQQPYYPMESYPAYPYEAQMPGYGQAYPLTGYPEGNFEQLYPDVYRNVYPYVATSIGEMMTQNIYDIDLTDDLLEKMTDDVLKKSGLSTDPEGMQEQAVPVQMGFGRGRQHDRFSLRDIVRILLLREFFDRRRHRRFPGRGERFGY